ncbi:MAG: FAD-binding protein [Rhodobacteraceae bacterium]|nr:FAD-binding protein [Paracoccaceae bacterium]MYF44861.1 FAD-binding protein [Paracoccaceae bacterium]MYI90336.1 FAD-binding protein [Paracoccaceae bacterium]
MEMPSSNNSIINDKDRLIGLFNQILSPNSVISDPYETKAYECDGLTAYKCPPLAVLLPRTTEEVSEILKICHEEKVPVIPRGAGTSLSGGALPTSDSVILGTSRLNNILDLDIENRMVRVQTGVTNLSVTEAVENEGFFYAPDPSSQLVCTIAGNIAMNSGGAHCLKYGVTTNNLLGVKIVLMDGSIMELGGEYLDSGGLDLLGVVCGSEGQLGIVTEAVLKIIPKPEGARPILLGFDSNVIAGNCVSDIIGEGILPVAIEFMDRLCIRACEDFVGAGYPDVEALLIVEVEGSAKEIDEQLDRIKVIASRHNPVAMKESKSDKESKLIWLGRKSAFGAMGRINDYMCLDGTIPVSRLPDVLEGISSLSEKYGLAVANVFHAGDGNLHPLILFNANQEGELEKCESLGADILNLCVDLGGCLSGEHGVGVEKRDLMTNQFSRQDLEIQMRVKDVFDPDWLLNPAKVFPLEISMERRLN